MLESTQAQYDTNEITIRPATLEDRHAIAKLMYSSGPGLYDYIYQTKKHLAVDYIEWEFAKEAGFCSYKLLTVAVCNGRVVGTGSFYDGKMYNTMSLHSLINLCRYYGFAVPGRVRRALQSTRLMEPPRRDELYLANFGVDPEMRGNGVGSQMINSKIAEARQNGYRMVSLDVSTANPRAEALYRRLGFVEKNIKSFVGLDGETYEAMKMEYLL